MNFDPNLKKWLKNCIAIALLCLLLAFMVVCTHATCTFIEHFDENTEPIPTATPRPTLEVPAHLLQ